MTLENYYLHAIEPHGDRNPFDIELALNKLEKIVSSGYILSRRKIGDTQTHIGGWNGIDYISLCDYSKRNKTNVSSSSLNNNLRYDKNAPQNESPAPVASTHFTLSPGISNISPL